jgi:catechol 2,3-dioxygenase-like lactoylglutathione lyase family enzyme
MLTNVAVTTILPVKNMERARKFYAETLGLKPLGFAPDGNFVFACGSGAQIALITKPDGTKAEHTAMSFDVADIRKEIAELEGRGVVPCLRQANTPWRNHPFAPSRSRNTQKRLSFPSMAMK